MTLRPGPRNLITDVPGLFVGNASDADLKSGATVLTADAPFTAAVHVMGGAPGSVETDLLAPDKLVTQVDALVLSGGSAFGLAAADGVRGALRARGRGFAVGDQRVPIVPGAILFDLLNGGNKSWGDNPYTALGAAAFDAAGRTFDLGSFGAGTGAMTATLKGGIGSASLQVGSITIGALVAVNALGSATVGNGPHFWAAPFEMEGEFGARGPCLSPPPPSLPTLKAKPGEATTIAIVATDAALNQAQSKRLAVAAHDGLARALVPSHSLLDGDLVFAASTGAQALPDPLETPFQLGHAAAICLARAVARAVHSATPAPGDTRPCWHSLFEN
ncbi:P1 family peptidase [Meridianimarinicoccus aquatilis]|uniref:P1 family peptidase n=1 Tax=Meridianimarinicoccus aquatilis TaxID=2552766 RepID=UPI0026A00A50